MSNVPYASAVRNSMCAMLCARPDTCFAVGLVSCYQSNPRLAHWQIIKRVEQYLRGTTNLILCYQEEISSWENSQNIDWRGDSKESKSTSGHSFTLGRRAMSWSSKKQKLHNNVSYGGRLCVTIETKEIAIKYMYTKKVFVSLLTKLIPSDTFKTHMLSLGVCKVQFRDISCHVMDKVLLQWAKCS